MNIKWRQLENGVQMVFKRLQSGLKEYKMLRKVVLIAIAIIVLLKCESDAYSHHYRTEKDIVTTTTMEPSSREDDAINFDEIMTQCNESFRITPGYLEEFNTTGSFPDESDKTPMCYIRCFLEKAGILKDGVIVDVEKAKQNLWQLSGDSFDVCQDEAKSEKHPCKKAYFIARCLMTRAIVDGRVVG